MFHSFLKNEKVKRSTDTYLPEFLKDSIIFSLNTKSSNFENILYTKQDQLAISQELSRNLQTDLKKQKLKTKLFGGTGILIAAGVIFILK